MKKYILLFSVVLVALLFISNTKENDQSNEKIIICHIPPGEPENAHPIEIDLHAWPAHEAHGDVIGDCSQSSRPDDGQDDIHKDETVF